MSDEKALHDQLSDTIARTIAMLEGMEALEHRVATIVEGGRQQLSHLVSDLKLPDMRAELRNITACLKMIEKKL